MDSALIIGYGKLGSHLYNALKHSRKIKISGVIKSSKSKLTISLVNKADLIFICTQDSKIQNAAKQLSAKSFDLTNKYIFHTSGSLSSEVLKPLERKGAFTGSLHPVQTFDNIAKKDAGRFKEIYIAGEGNDKAYKKIIQVSKYIKAKPFRISAENKVYHHICCVIASNFMAALIRQIEKIGSKKIQINGFKKLSFFNIYKPLASQTLSNIAKKGAVKSLTGPIERNDHETIIKHLEALSNSAGVLPVYLLMGIETVKLALEKKSIKPAEAKRILKTFDKHIKTAKKH